jgi:hypothetical protein
MKRVVLWLTVVVVFFGSCAAIESRYCSRRAYPDFMFYDRATRTQYYEYFGKPIDERRVAVSSVHGILYRVDGAPLNTPAVVLLSTWEHRCLFRVRERLTAVSDPQSGVILGGESTLLLR